MADLDQLYLFPNVSPIDLALFIKRFVFSPSNLRATLIIYHFFFFNDSVSFWIFLLVPLAQRLANYFKGQNKIF